MCALDTLTDRIRAEFTELPTLKITQAQACRLWHVDEVQCRAALDSLVADGFLWRSPSGAFVALPCPRRKSVKASIADAALPSRCAAAIV